MAERERMSIRKLLSREVLTKLLYLGGDPLNGTAPTLVTVGAAHLNSLAGVATGAAFTVAAEAADTITVAVQLKDALDAALAVRAGVLAYLSDDATGDSVVATAPSGNVVIGTDGLAIPLVAKKCFAVTSEANGKFDLSLTEAGAKTVYLVVVLPTGKLAVSGAITFAA